MLKDCVPKPEDFTGVKLMCSPHIPKGELRPDPLDNSRWLIHPDTYEQFKLLAKEFLNP